MRAPCSVRLFDLQYLEAVGIQKPPSSDQNVGRVQAQKARRRPQTPRKTIVTQEKNAALASNQYDTSAVTRGSCPKPLRKETYQQIE
jgi:hypothetical protein